MLKWHDHNEQIVKDLIERQGHLKIILKTRDDPLYLRDWISHHASIVGIDNLIIVDNGSTDEGVLSVYRDLAPDLFVFSFRGHYNDIHALPNYYNFYHGLEYSCWQWIFLDTDERLVWLDSHRWSAGPDLLRRIKTLGSSRIIPTALIENFIGRRDTFHVHPPERIAAAWKYGKPIVPSAMAVVAPAMGEHICLHNCQFSREAFDSVPTTNIAILHLVTSDRDQRLAANRLKLIADRFATEHDSFEDILGRPRDALSSDDIVHRLVSEIRTLLEWDTHGVGDDETPSGTMRLMPDGRLNFHGDDERRSFNLHLYDAEQFVRDVLSENPR